MNLQELFGFPDPLDYLHESRLRHFGLFVKDAPRATRAITFCDPKMAQALSEAIDWFWKAIQDDYELPHYDEWQPWETMMTQRPTRWKKLISIARARHLGFKIQMNKITRWYRTLAETIGIDMQIKKDITTCHYCTICEMGFKSCQSWFMHTSQLHGYRTPAGRAASGQICFCCGKKYYPTPQALENHMRYNKVCRVFALTRPAASVGIDGDAHPQFPRTREFQNQNFTADEFDPDQHDLLEKLWATWEQHYELSDCYEALQQTLRFAAPFATIYVTFDLWKEAVCRQPCSQAANEELTRVQHWLDSLRVSNLEEVLPLTTEELRKQLMAPRIAPRTWSYLPRELYFLHLFSGRRRDKDLQFYLENCICPPGVCLFTISVDVQVCPNRCNLRDGNQQFRWLSLIRQGLVAGLTTGPPCETWTKARAAQLDGDLPGPRPLRHRCMPWGLLNRFRREWLQLGVGNDLMTFSVLALLLQGITGGFGMLEHPADPEQYTSEEGVHPSIWDTAAMKWLEETGLFRKEFLMQGHCGGLTPKPTNLMFTGVPSTWVHDLAKACRTTALPKSSAIGRSEWGKGWKTAPLKEYPPQLCKYISGVFQLWLDHKAKLPLCEVREDMTWLKDLCVSLEVVGNEPGRTYGPDFYKG